MAKRIGNFLLELFVFFPLSALVTACAWFPVFGVFYTLQSEPMNLLVFIPILAIFWFIAFWINKFRLHLKGRETDEYYDVAYDNVSYTAEEAWYSSDVINITEHHDVGTYTASSNTFWGWVGIILSFVSLPLSFIAVIMSFFALFFPAIYSTPRELEGDMHPINHFLHTLFDFVILPARMYRMGEFSPWGFLICLAYIALPVLSFLGVALLQEFIVLPPMELEWLGILGFFLVVFLLLDIVVFTIVKCVFVVIDFSKERVFDGFKFLIPFNVLFAVAFMCMLFFL